MRSPFLDRLEQGPMLADGGMGSMLYAAGVDYRRSLDEQNLVNPTLVQSIHRRYIEAGAELIETNTFGANRFMLANHGLSDRVRDVNFWGVKIAREAREITGESVFLAGALGPTGLAKRPGANVSSSEVEDSFREQIEALLEAGPDVLVLESFTDLAELELAVRVARASCELPVVAQLTFTDDGVTLSGQVPGDAARALEAAGADVIGANCSVGPQGIHEVLAAMRPHTKRPLSGMPNAGLPGYVEGRFFYLSSPQYFADYTKRLLGTGVSLIGGCCGTTPEHITAMAAVIREQRPAVTVRIPSSIPVQSPEPERAENHGPTPLSQKLAAGRFVCSVEIDPPRGSNPTKVVAGAALLKEAGADVINIGDSPMARVRMSALATATIIQREVGIDTIIHFTSRDRNLMGLQADLLGAHSLGVRNILALTGDPPRLGNHPNATGVWDVDSIGLVAVLKRLNEGQDWSGSSIGRATDFFVGCAVNPTADDLETEIERFRRKIANGADFVMTQPFYDPKVWEDFLAQIGKLPVPVIVGIMPLQSSKHTEFLHNEVPGITIPDYVRERMRKAGERGIAEGLALSRDLLDAVRGHCQGVYFMPSFGRYEIVAEMVRSLRD
ncbi:MAG: bifunctional homocysteine S-methyltransferase/methylenetetrahydrofolate reductase [Chloroflexi bacterium]|nr:bifunctional homocysteine S-methyltransferase/methylenetetrahydrofolate reductase [Chloroflexota bacterium]